MTRQTDAGFTLIETLVALLVLALTAMALLGATEAHVARIAGLERRAAALWAAESHLAERGLGLTPDAAPEAMLGYAFRIEEQRSPTADPDLDRIDLVVTDASDGQVYGRLTGFLAGGPAR
jgi:general secretion pathway protein I